MSPISAKQADVTDNTVRKADLFRTLFENPYGERVLNHLREEFCIPTEDLLQLPDREMRDKIAQRDVIEYIEKLMEFDRV